MDLLTKHSTANNPVLKIVAGVLFITFPIIGFILGMQFSYLTIEPKIIYKTEEKIIYKAIEDNERRLIKRCGNYPNLSEMPDGKWERTWNISWSPDCKNLVWSNNKILFCENGPEDNCSEIASNQSNGLFLYNSCSKTVKKIVSSEKQNNDPYFIRWIDSKTILYSNRSESIKKEYKIN